MAIRNQEIGEWKIGSLGLLAATTLIILVGIIATTYLTQQTTEIRSKASTPTGNLAPAGPHYNLNLIGVPKEKTTSITETSGHRIFVPLVGSCQIRLSSGDFLVLDGNCTDGTGKFQLPNPDADNDGVTTYSVWARALGKPGGQSSATTCATDPLIGQLYCSLSTQVSIRNKGKSSFENVTKELLYVYADINADGTAERVPLFDDRLQNYYWQYDNNKLKLVQLRFYEISTTVP